MSESLHGYKMKTADCYTYSEPVLAVDVYLHIYVGVQVKKLLNKQKICVHRHTLLIPYLGTSSTITTVRYQ